MKTHVTMARFTGNCGVQMKAVRCVIVLSCILVGLGKPAHAQSCSLFGQNIVNAFGTISQGYEGLMQVALASNRSDGRYVSYGELPAASGNNGGSGSLVYVPAHTAFGFPYPAYLHGTLAQFFSDRRFNVNGFVSDPFDPQKTDSLGVVIYLEGSAIFGINAGEVMLVLNSWGGGRLTFQGDCQNDMILGFCGQSCASSGYLNTEFVLSLFNQEVVQKPK